MIKLKNVDRKLSNDKNNPREKIEILEFQPEIKNLIKKAIMKDLNYANFGKLLIKLQFLETLIKLFISLFNSGIKENKKYRIKDLSTRNILDDNTEKIKQTLGQLMNIIKSEMPNFDNEEFKELVSKRNTFIHSFHKEFLSKKDIDEKEIMKFIEELWLLTDKYTKVFTGLISVAAKSIGKGKISIQDIEEDEKHLYNYLIENSKQTAHNMLSYSSQGSTAYSTIPLALLHAFNLTSL